ncbi:MAG: amino acid ABC transporter permease [Paralcaligenes sp.]
MKSHVELMFDPPGPKGRRTARRASIISCIVLAAIVALVIHLFSDSGGLDAQKWAIFTSPAVWALLAKALGATLKAALTAGFVALALGVVLALLRLSRKRWLCMVVGSYVEVTRSLPTLLVLYFTILMLPHYGIRLPVYWQLVLALTLTNAALISEILRASLLSVPQGQTEAALSLGLTRSRALVFIVLPQGFRAAMPALIAQLIYLLKGTTLGYVISYEEMLFSARLIGEYTGFILQSFLVVTVIYFVLDAGLSQLALWLDRRLAASATTKAPLLLSTDG